MAKRGHRSKHALREFAAYLLTCPEGSDFGVGTCWNHVEGWKAYMRVGERILVMGSKEARHLARAFLKEIARADKSDTPVTEGFKPMFEELHKIAGEIKDLNRRKVIPSGAVAAMPPGGTA